METTEQQLKTILDIAIGLSKETDNKQMLNIILEKSMGLCNCDSGTLYILKDGRLHFMLMKTLSMGIDRGMDGEEIDIPPVPLCKEKISSCLTKRLLKYLKKWQRKASLTKSCAATLKYVQKEMI